VILEPISGTILKW